MNCDVIFDGNGESLWVEMDMKGLYRIIYEYELWSKEAGKPVILMKDAFKGSNEDDNHPDFTQIRNDYAPTEPLADFDGYEVAVSFKIIKKDDSDTGYRIGLIIKQGTHFDTSNVIGRCYSPADEKESGKVGEQNFVKEEYLVVTLKRN